MKQISTHVWQLDMGFVNAYLIDDGELTLVDTGFAGSTDKILGMIAKAGKDLANIKRILLTHSHADHSGSVAALQLKLFVPVFAHPLDADMMMYKGSGGSTNYEVSPGIINWLLYHLYIKRAGTSIKKPFIADYMENGDVLPIAGGVQVIHTPGHTPGHVSLLIPADRLLIAGDICMTAMGLDLSMVYENRKQGIESIIKAAQHDFDVAVFGHGNALKGRASARMMEQFSALIHNI